VLVVAAPTRLTVTVPAAAKKVAMLRVRLVLSPTKAVAVGSEIGATTARNVAAHRARRIVVTATVPAASPVAAYLIACARAGSAKERCVVLRRVALSPDASASARIEAERAAGLITTSAAIHQLAASLHAASGGGAGDDAIARFRALWPLASPADRTFMLPTFLPPDTVGSAWALKKTKVAPARSTRARRAVDPCDRFTARDAVTWVEVPAAGGKVLFHFDPGEPAQTRTTFVSAMDTYIYTPLTTGNGFREPLGDGKETCAHGGDGRLDIFISSDITAGGGGFTNTYPPTLEDICVEEPQPVFIALNPRFGVVALAHEFFHAVQMAYAYRKTCTGAVRWFDEATGVWGEYLAYPGNSFTLVERGHQVRSIAGFHEPYASWIFWYAMAKDHGGTTVVSDALTALEGAKPHTEVAAVHALDGALPGGLRKGLEDFAGHAWNQDPIGSSGFPIATDYRGWHIDSGPPSRPAAPTVLKLDGGTLKLVRLQWPGSLAFGAREYTNVTVPDPSVRELQWTSGFANEPGQDVQAYLRVGSTWHVEDWSGRKTVTLCRDQAGEDVDQIILATTNADLAHLSLYTGYMRKPDTMRLRRRCSFPIVYTGTWTRTIESPSSGWKETITGTARFIREPLLPDIAEQLIPIPYNLDHATATWVVSGHSAGGGNTCQVSYSGSGTETSFNDADAYDKTRLVLQDATAYLQTPSATPFYYAIDVLGKRLHPPKYDITEYGSTTCGGGRQEVTWTDYLDIGLFQDASAITPGDPLLETSSATRTLAGTRTYTDISIGDNVITDTWSFAGTD
jgi:hypothetical protein